jgi:hypothetical protein
MAFLAGIGRAISRVLRRVGKILRKVSFRAIRGAVKFALFPIQAVLAGLFPSVAEHMAQKMAEAEAKKAAEAAAQRQEPEEPEEEEALNGPEEVNTLNGPDEELPGLKSKPEDPEQQSLSRFQKLKTTATDVKDDLLAKTGLAGKSLTEQTPKGLNVNTATSDGLKQGTDPIKEKLDAATANNNNTPAAPQQKARGQKLKS